MANDDDTFPGHPITSISFPDDYHVISRDFLSVKVWDKRTASLVRDIPVFTSVHQDQELLQESLGFSDKFTCGSSTNLG